MFSLGDSDVYYLSRRATDMRKGFDALCGEVRRGMGRDPVSGEVFYDSYKNIDEHKVYVSMPLFVRGKYTFFDEEASVRPFVALDLGYLLALDGHQHDYGSEQKRYRSGLIAEPQVGVIFKNKYSLSLGYYPDSISVPCYGESFEHSS